MTKRFESRLTMYLAVRDYLNAHAALVGTLPNYASTFTAFNNAVTQIHEKSQFRLATKVGVTQNKTQLAKDLITMMYDHSVRLQAYAKTTGNKVLLAEVTFNATELNRLADTTRRDLALMLHSKVQANLGPMSSYAVNATTQTAFMNLITAYTAAIPQPRLNSVERKKANEQMRLSAKAAEEQLSYLDLVISLLRNTQPNFYSGYENVRRVIYTGNTTLALRAQVVDAATQEPLPSAVVTFYLGKASPNAAGGQGKQKPLVKKTAAKGGFIVKSLEAGAYTVKAEKKGYATREMPLSIEEGVLQNMVIALQKTE